MKNQESYERKGKHYMVAFIAVTVLNLMLGAFLIHKSFGQTNKHAEQKPLTIEVVAQNDSPLQITLINVDNSAPSFQVINLAVQNTGNKPVRAYSVYAEGKLTGRTVTSNFAAKLLQQGESYNNRLPVERENIKADEKLSLSVDYVEFEDGSSWGDDTQQRSMKITAEREGRKAAIKQIKDLVKNQDFNTLTNLFSQEITELSFPLQSSNQTTDWQNSFQGGYRSAIAILREYQKRGIDSLSTQLDEMEKIHK